MCAAREARGCGGTVRSFAGSAAVRWPPLSAGLWAARMAQLWWRVLSARDGPKLSLLVHTPGILWPCWRGTPASPWKPSGRAAR